MSFPEFLHRRTHAHTSYCKEQKTHGFTEVFIDTKSLKGGFRGLRLNTFNLSGRAEIIERGSAEHIVLPDTSLDTNLHDSVDNLS
ncbi:hypothetical protein Pint_04642 [Pistacia integerrima]|uniref:Uncharacterized protein n=1 Tax=Pistacia integerrima TaxID=434235 RepID=A0ACC0Z0L0_9ROSI|nr:hypothetical protein Pint_04642 [Pistacia integerrima]